MKPAALSIGLIVPINNTTMERELLAWLPQGSACRAVGIPRGKGLLAPEDLPAYLANRHVDIGASSAPEVGHVAQRLSHLLWSVGDGLAREFGDQGVEIENLKTVFRVQV